MNILASYNSLKYYCPTDLSAEDFAAELSLKSMSVESIDHLAPKFAHMVVGVIREVVAHPKADRLRIAKTDIGSAVVDIVCGGSNLAVNQKVAVALPGAKVRWHGEGDLVELQETEIRGVKSIGMICAASEIGFDKIPSGEREIWDLTALTNAPAGTSLADALDLNDILFDVEITSNRPDCMGIMGLARESATATGTQFVPPTFYSLLSTFSAPNTLTVSILDPKHCPRYMAIAVEGVKVGPSPWWLQKKLLLAGFKPINNIVDITNLVLHEYGQPLHAFDASKIEGNKIEVRRAQKGESILALDGKTYQLSTKDLVIADSTKPIAIAGIMGGLESSTQTGTTSVVFEAATFEPVGIRKSSRSLNLQSDAQLVYEKGLSTEALPQALAYAVQLAQEIAGGKQGGGVVDIRDGVYHAQTYPVRYKKIRARIGVDIPDARIDEILTSLGFALEKSGSKTVATVPFWRDHDIEAEIDLTEEVARMYGYHNMPAMLPAAVPPPAADDASLVWESRLKHALMCAGFTETFGYSLVDALDLEKYGISPSDALALKNPLSADLTHMRPSLMPSLLTTIEHNQSTTASAKIFEISRVYLPTANTSADELPSERLSLVCAIYGEQNPETALRELRTALNAVASASGLSYSLARLSDDAHWHPSRSASIHVASTTVGSFGQVADAYQVAFGITRPVFAFTLDIEGLVPYMSQKNVYTPVENFPTVTRDVAYLVAHSTEFATLSHTAHSASLIAPTVLKSVSYIETYTGEGIPAGQKSVTLSFTLASPAHTLTTPEIESAITAISSTLEKECGAKVR